MPPETHISGRCFVSYKFDSRGLPPADLDGMCRKLNRLGAKPVIFRSENQRDIGARLISALRRCDSLAYLATSEATASPWVSLELYHARRLGLPIYMYDPKSDAVTADKSIKTHLPVYPSYTPGDANLVRPILDYFHSSGILTWDDRSLKGDQLWENEIKANLGRWIGSGGIIVFFISSKSLQSNWVKNEYERGLKTNQVLPVLLERKLKQRLPPSLEDTDCSFNKDTPPQVLVSHIKRMIKGITKEMEDKDYGEDLNDLKPCPKAISELRGSKKK
jgi:TIR domain